jgi:hypothetical protein
LERRERLAEAVKVTLRSRQRERENERYRKSFKLNEGAVAPVAPERAPDLPIEEVRKQLKDYKPSTPEEEEDLAVAQDWARRVYGDPVSPFRSDLPKWHDYNREKYDRQVLANIAEARLQRELSEQYLKEFKDRSAAQKGGAKSVDPEKVVPPSVVLESPAPLDPEHADLADLDDRQLSAEWSAVQQDMKDMRADGIKTTDEDYLSNKARLNAMFAVMAQRAQEGNREYIGGTPSRLEKLQELAKAISSESDLAKRSALEAQLVRVFRGVSE